MSSESDRSEHRPSPGACGARGPLLTPGDAKGIPAPAAMPTTELVWNVAAGRHADVDDADVGETVGDTQRSAVARNFWAPTFNGKEVSEFLRTLHSLFRNHGITREEGKISALCDYVSVSVCEWVESLPEYEEEGL
ncbi:hypothetical protein MAP00_001735 [Monascus purpureus]|nr:hypothetical protein MAP00_001735 [Monascus purpureus]